jgi:hypothetical protein
MVSAFFHPWQAWNTQEVRLIFIFLLAAKGRVFATPTHIDLQGNHRYNSTPFLT